MLRSNSSQVRAFQIDPIGVILISFAAENSWNGVVFRTGWFVTVQIVIEVGHGGLLAYAIFKLVRMVRSIGAQFNVGFVFLLIEMVYFLSKSILHLIWPFSFTNYSLFSVVIVLWIDPIEGRFYSVPLQTFLIFLQDTWACKSKFKSGFRSDPKLIDLFPSLWPAINGLLLVRDRQFLPRLENFAVLEQEVTLQNLIVCLLHRHSTNAVHENRVRVPFFTLAFVLNLLPIAGVIVETLWIQSTVMLYIGVLTAVLILMIAAFYIVVAVKVVRLLNSFVANNKSKNKIRNLRRVSSFATLFVTPPCTNIHPLDSYLDHHFVRSCVPASDLVVNLRDDDAL